MAEVTTIRGAVRQLGSTRNLHESTNAASLCRRENQVPVIASFQRMTTYISYAPCLYRKAYALFGSRK